MKIDGKKIANKLINSLEEKTKKLRVKKIIPHLCIVTFGKNTETESYLNQKKLRAKQINAKITIKRFSTKPNAKEVYEFIEKQNKNNKVHGIIIQRPLAKNLSTEQISLLVDINKDIDGFHPKATFYPPVGLAVIKLIESTIDNENIYEYLKSKKIVIVGKGVTAGKPTINLFEKLKINVKVIDSKTKNADKLIKSADIIISAVGKKYLTKDVIKRNATLIGIGMHSVSGKLKGDYEEIDIKDHVSFYSPTPGGVGPVNVTMLMKNLIEAAEIN